MARKLLILASREPIPDRLLGLDLYLWVVYRTFTLQNPLRLSWKQLYRQFGSDPAKTKNKHTVDAFRTDCLRELKKVRAAWPEFNYPSVPM